MKSNKEMYKKAYEKGGYRERFAMDNGTAIFKKWGSNDCVSFEYSLEIPYQDGNGATYDLTAQKWIN